MQLFSLGHVAGKTIQQPAVRPSGGEGFENHGNGDGIRNEFPFIHVFLRLFTKLRAASHMLAENGAGFDVRNAEGLPDQGSLSALAAPIGAEHKNIHEMLLLVMEIRAGITGTKLARPS